MTEIITVAEMYAADRYAAEHGVPSLTLMENAGSAVADACYKHWRPQRTLVLCGPGNNGGDGFVAARLLKASGWDVRVALVGQRSALKGDAAHMARLWTDATVPLSREEIGDADLVIDALFGAGLQRALEGAVREAVEVLNESGKPVLAVDVPSGLHGDSAKSFDGLCVKADVTVTFFRKKPAHVLMPGRLQCGHVLLAQIGIPTAALQSKLYENGPSLWGARLPRLDPEGHKYGRGHAVVVSGPAHATGAARLAARGALRIGAGLVSVASPASAVLANAAQLTAIMVKPFEHAQGLAHLLEDKRFNAVALGPGLGVGPGTRELAAAVLNSGAAAVLDADALTSYSGDAGALFRILRPGSVLTPHAGEFGRVFPGLLAHSPNRIEAARDAAAQAGCTVLLKGPDTVIAARDGRAAVNTNAPPQLATAGSGDVLTGFIAGLLAQGMEPFEAAAAAAWFHGEAAAEFGPGLISEDLPEQLPAVLERLYKLET